MTDKFMKMLEKKAKKGDLEELTDAEKEARMTAVGGLKQAMRDSMGEKLNGMKKVTVASDSKPGLEKGLDKAKELMKGMPGEEEESSEEEESETPEHEMSESPELEAAEHEEGHDASKMLEGMDEEEMKKLHELLMAKLGKSE